MGQRVAELVLESNHIGWVVYQSTAMAMFCPILSSQLSAELFAYILPSIGLHNWADDSKLMNLASDLDTFVELKLGEEPEFNDLYADFLDTDGELFQELVTTFKKGKKAT